MAHRALRLCLSQCAAIQCKTMRGDATRCNRTVTTRMHIKTRSCAHNGYPLHHLYLFYQLSFRHFHHANWGKFVSVYFSFFSRTFLSIRYFCSEKCCWLEWGHSINALNWLSEWVSALNCSECSSVVRIPDSDSSPYVVSKDDLRVIRRVICVSEFWEQFLSLNSSWVSIQIPSAFRQWLRSPPMLSARTLFRISWPSGMHNRKSFQFQIGLLARVWLFKDIGLVKAVVVVVVVLATPFPKAKTKEKQYS